MDTIEKGFSNIIAIIGVVVLVGASGYFVASQQGLFRASAPSPSSGSTATPKLPVKSDPTPQPADFNLIFGYGVGAKNRLDTFSQTFTKDMVIDPAVTVKFELTENELAGVYQKINDLKLFDNNQEPAKGNVFVTPCSSYYLKVQVGSVNRDLSFDDCRGKIADKFQQFINYILPIIESKEAYKSLPTPRAGYL